MDSSAYLEMFVVSIIVTVFGIVLTRLILSIPTFLRKTDTIIRLLSVIAEKQGVEPEKVERIRNGGTIKEVKINKKPDLGNR
jgi:uncharacterized membrane protein YqhA